MNRRWHKDAAQTLHVFSVWAIPPSEVVQMAEDLLKNLRSPKFLIYRTVTCTPIHTTDIHESELFAYSLHIADDSGTQ